ncbi:unnamed protein product [Calypogeia fissa]
MREWGGGTGNKRPEQASSSRRKPSGGAMGVEGAGMETRPVKEEARESKSHGEGREIPGRWRSPMAQTWESRSDNAKSLM